MQAPKRPIILAVASLCILAASASNLDAQAYTVQRGLAYQNAKDWQGLLHYTTAWTQAQPSNSDAWALMGSAYSLGLNQPDKAIEPMKRAVALIPNSAPAWHALGVTYVLAKDYHDAVDAIKHAIQINPNQPTYYNNLAAAYAGGAAWTSALATFDQEKPLAQRLNNANVWYVLGNGYAKMGDLPNAIAAYRADLQLKPDFAEGWTNLGAALQFNGDDAGAKQAYHRGQALGDPLAGKDEAQLEAQEAQAQRQANAIHRGVINSNVSHMYDYYHGVQAGTDISRTY